MKRLVYLAPVAVALLLIAAAQKLTGDPVPQFRPLFNGKDLTGWVNVNTDQDTWSFATA